MKSYEMTPRERVLATVKGEPVDQVPVLYWFNSHAACKLFTEHKPAKSKLWNMLGSKSWNMYKKEFRFVPEDIRAALPLLLQVYANRDYAYELGADLSNLQFGNNKFWLDKIYIKGGKLRIKDGFGSIRGMGGIYLDVVEPVIKDFYDIKNFKFPDAKDDKHYTTIKKFRKSKK